ncbi:ionotropic receptor 75a-like [Lutzomyia longipalpis]|uniref:ionotropic receptor 75a-like n=1 Tax=Lutzomyia longipalpis TaxID=7200 RepID=UPI002484244F|nr:ionotropic receptor 75a-like [Lutzomyia longipalpis]
MQSSPVLLSAVIRAILQLLGSPFRITGNVFCSNPSQHFSFLKSFAAHPNDESPAFFTDSLSGSDYRNVEEHRTVVLVDFDCPTAMEILANASHQEIYYNYKWILFHTTSREKIQIPTDLRVLVSSEVFVLHPDGEENVAVEQVYRHRPDTPQIWETFGLWRGNQGVLEDHRSTPITSRRRQNTQKALLRASMVITHNDTLQHLDDYHDKHIDTITKVNYILTNHLIDYVNGSVAYSIVPTWGYFNGSAWSGMIGELDQDLADLGASPLFYTVDRIPVIQYIAMTTPTRSKFVFRSPKLSFTDNVFILPFDTFVWYSLITLMILLVLILTLAAAIEWRTLDIDPEDSQSLRPKIMEAFMVVFGASCQQGSSQNPRGFSTRCITFLAFIVLFFLYTSYSANIVALLQSPSRKIKTLPDLLASRLKFGVDDTVFNRYYFTHQTEPIRKAIYEQKVIQRGSPAFMALEQGIKLLRGGLFAFHMETGVGYKVVTETFFESEKCDLQEIQFYELIDPWYAIQKNSSFKEVFKVGLFRMQENGLQERENSLLYTKKPECHGSGGNFVTVGLIDIQPAMLLFAWGIIISLGIFCIEFGAKKFKHELQQRMKCCRKY